MLFANPKRAPRLEALTDEDPVSLLPVDPEDMWHANNLITVDDTIRAHAVRKVVRETATGSTSTDRVHTDLTIAVTSTFFDPAASSLHVSGRVVGENKFVSTGQYHTLDLELNRPFTIWKRHGWDSVAITELRNALHTDTSGAIAAVIMQEGAANICLITESRTVLKQRVESDVSRKRGTGLKTFHSKTLNTLLRTIDFLEPRPLLLASPGYVATDFRIYIAEEGARRADKMLIKLARDAVVTHSSGGDLKSLAEVMNNKEVVAVLGDRRFATESRYMDNLFDKIRKDDGRGWYGVSTVSKAVEEGAVGRGGGVLLVNNSLFRSQDIATRKRYVALVDKVKEDGGDARILSADHESGQRLASLGGIAAMLTYPMYDLDDDGPDIEGGPQELETSII